MHIICSFGHAIVFNLCPIINVVTSNMDETVKECSTVYVNYQADYGMLYKHIYII